MLKPVAARSSPLIAKRAQSRGEISIRRDNHSALAGGDLFVGIKSKYSGIPKRPDFALLIFRSNRLAGIFYHPKAMAARDIDQFRNRRRTPECMHNHDSAGPRRNRSPNSGRVDVQRLWFDIDKDRRRSLVANSISDSDESKGRHQNFVTFAKSQSTNT